MSLPISDLKNLLPLNKGFLSGVAVWGILAAAVSIAKLNTTEDCDELRGFTWFGVALGVLMSLYDAAYEWVQDTFHLFRKCRDRHPSVREVLDVEADDSVGSETTTTLTSTSSTAKRAPRTIYCAWFPFISIEVDKHKALCAFLLYGESVVRLSGNVVLFVAYVATIAHQWFLSSSSSASGSDAAGAGALCQVPSIVDHMLYWIYAALALSVARLMWFFTFKGARDTIKISG
eukprot:m51a1_g1103 hypothetical protein (232) ;mRNA; r:124265-124960